MIATQQTTDKTQSSVEVARAKNPGICSSTRRPNLLAIEATALARNRLSTEEQNKLDHRLERLIIGKRLLAGKKPLPGPASGIGNLKDVQEVIDAGADINLTSIGKGKDALSCEIDNKKRTEVVNLLLTRGANVDCSKLTETCYFRSCTSIIQLLLEYGVDPNSWQQVEASPLGIAAQYGNTPGVRLLMAHGALPDAVNSKCIKGTPLSSACYRLHIETVRALLECGADPNATGNGHFNPAQAAIEVVKERASSAADNGRQRLAPILKILEAYGAEDKEIKVYLDPYSDANRALIHPWDYSRYLKDLEKERRSTPGLLGGAMSNTKQGQNMAILGRPVSTISEQTYVTSDAASSIFTETPTARSSTSLAKFV